MNRKILYVDDEESILKGISLHLRKGFELYTAGSGDEALEVFEKEGPFAVVVSDMRMPGIAGATLLAKIKERDSSTLTVLLTGHADFEFGGAAALNEGHLFRILTKPCPPERLRQTLEEALRQYDSEAGSAEGGGTVFDEPIA